jgi:hypothetical protein
MYVCTVVYPRHAADYWLSTCRKAAAQQADQEGGEGDDEEEAGLPEDVPGAQE